MLNREEKALELLCSVEQKGCKKLTCFLEEWTKGLFVILRVIEKANSEVTAGDLASTLGVSTARIAVALKTLEVKKWIKKCKAQDDARKTIVILTNIGEKVLKEKEVELVKIISSFLEKLSDEEVLQLTEIIKKII